MVGISAVRPAGVVLLLLLAAAAQAQKFYTYVEDLGPDFVQLSWGTADGSNTIGRSSPSHGEAIVKIAGRTLASRPGSIVVADLQPDHPYTYEVWIRDRKIGSGEVRTWPVKTTRLCFFVIGDYGTGNGIQYEVARAMWQEFQRREATDNPVRFVITTGDNIYGNISGFLLGISHTGAADSDWAPKFFEPYEQIIARIPWFPSLGNHDGNETENRRDLDAYLDNFPFPGDKPARYYHFTYGGLAEFFSLDSTRNTESGPSQPGYLEGGAEFQWMKQEFAKANAPWVIPFYHHPVFNAGPLHAPNLRDLAHWLPVFRAAHVRVVFNGHEHNFQMSEADDLSYGIRFITSGAGGELRPGDVRKNMKRANIAAWCGQNHFLEVEIDGKTMRVTPLSFAPLSIYDSDGRPIRPPFTITLP